VNEDLEAAHKRAIDALKAAEIEVILHFDDPDIIQEKLNLIRTTLRIEANDTPFLARTMDFRASFAGSL
jgi:hypothetical protein